MKDSLLNDEVMADFQKNFEGIEFSHRAVEIGNGVAHAMFLKYGNVTNVELTWRKVSNFTALNCQSSISDDFGKWNTYLFFLVNEKINIDLKYKIENDTFSSRKIVIEDSSLDFETIINSHIINGDLKLTIREADSQKDFIPNPELWTLLDGKTLKVKKRTGIADETFDELLSLLKPAK